MESCRTDAIGAVNSYMRQLRDDPEMTARISLVIFDSESIDTIRDRSPAKSCAELDAKEYQPRASTPLLDAVGSGAALLAKHAAKDERAILAIMTDGLENASKEYTNEQIKTLLDRRRKEDGWLVVYLGADHDSWAQAQRMGLEAGTTADFSKARVGSAAKAMYAMSSRYMKSRDRKAVFLEAERADMKGDDKT